MHGFIYRAPAPEDYKQNGRVRLGGIAIRPDGQWDNFLPTDERQNLAMEPEACTSFGTLNCVEILIKQEFGENTNWSDRFLAEISGTTQGGNDPHTVAETLRKKGVPFEAEWPYTAEINTWGKFYQTPPLQVFAIAASEFKAVYDFAHQYVGTDIQSMKTALQYSPLGVDVFAWNQSDNDDVYHRGGNGSNHWVCIYGYNPGRYWKCFDSYDNTHKKLAWDFGFTMVKQYTIHKAVVQDGVLKTAWNFFRQWLGLPLI